MEENVFRVPVRDCMLKDCFKRLFAPSRDHQEFIPTVIEVLLFMLGLVYPNPKLRLIRAKSMGSNGSDPTSELGLVDRSFADLTTPDFYKIPAREHLSNAGILFVANFALVFREFPGESSPEVFGLLLNPIGLWAVLGSCVVSWLICKRVMKADRQQKDNTSAVPDLSLPSQRPNERVQKRFYNRMKFNLSFWTGVTLSTLGSYVMVIFLRPPAQMDSIYDVPSLRAALREDKYRIMFDSRAAANTVITRLSNEDQRLFRSKTLRLKSIEEGLDLLMGDKISEYPRHVYIMDTMQAETVESYICDIKFVLAPEFGCIFLTSFLRPGLKLPFKGYEIQVVRREERRVRKRNNPHIFCPRPRDDPKTLSFENVDGALVIFILLQCLAVILFVGEKFININGWCRKCRRKG